MNTLPLPFSNELNGISPRTIEVHHDKLYAGYVAKTTEIQKQLAVFERERDLTDANQTYSELRSLKTDETFAVNGSYLHEYYFEVLGGNGHATGPLVDALAAQFGSLERFIQYFSACGMAARGWVVLAWDTHESSLRVYTGDAHNHGGVWGAIPVIVLDVYEHAYFMDSGSDRKTYIQHYWENFHWNRANELYQRAIAR